MRVGNLSAPVQAGKPVEQAVRELRERVLANGHTGRPFEWTYRTRAGDDVPSFVRDYVTWGAGPRATQFLILAAKARAVLHGRYYVSCEDVRAVAPPVLRHRIITNFNAEAEGIKPDNIVQRLIDVIPRDPNEKA